MPVNQGTTLPIFQGNLLGKGFTGISIPLFAAALANATTTYWLTGIGVRTVDKGTAGGGTGLGIPGLTTILSSGAINGPMFGSLQGSQFTGTKIPELSLALSNSFSSIFAISSAITAHPSVGVGSGTVFLTPNPGVSNTVFPASFLGAGLIGDQSVKLALAIANGLNQSIPAARGEVPIVGPASPTTSSGVGTGRLV